MKSGSIVVGLQILYLLSFFWCEGFSVGYVYKRALKVGSSELEAELFFGDPKALELLGEYLCKKYSMFYLHSSKRARCEAYRLLHKG